MPGAICGTRAPTAKNLVATAMPMWPVAGSRAMIDHVISYRLFELSSCRIALHAPGIGGSTAAAANPGGGSEAAFRPIRADLDDVAAALQGIDGRLRDAVLDHQHAGACGTRPERDRELFGVPRGRVDRFLQVQLGVDMAQE